MKTLILTIFLCFIFQPSFGDEYLLIKDGKVINKIVSDSNHADSISDKHDFVKKVDSSNRAASIGWGYDNGLLGVGATFTPPPKLPKPPETAEEADLRIQRENKKLLHDQMKVECGPEPVGLLKTVCTIMGG